MAKAGDKEILQAFGVAVRERRHQLGLSQERLAELADLHRTYIADIERGIRNVGLLNVVRVAQALDVSPAELLTRVGPTKTTSRKAR